MTTSIKTTNDKTRTKRKYTRRKHPRKQVSQVLDKALPITPDQPLHLLPSCDDQGAVLSASLFQKRRRGRPKKVKSNQFSPYYPVPITKAMMMSMITLFHEAERLAQGQDHLYTAATMRSFRLLFEAQYTLTLHQLDNDVYFQRAILNCKSNCNK